MNKLELLNAINQYSFDGKNEKIIEILNELFYSNEYKAHLNLVFDAISITQMYGFLSYLTDGERTFFLQCDRLRSDTYRGKRIDFLNSGQLSLLLDFDFTNKVFLSAPTSFGKTSLLIEYIISNYSKLNNVLLIVPTNSLLEELFSKIIYYNKQYEMGYIVSTQPYFKKNANNFLIITPERFLLLNEETEVNKFDLIVLDETYKIVDSRNEKISDFIENRSVRFRKVADIIGHTPNKLFLLSPFTYELTKSMSDYLRKYNIKKIDRKIEYVKREIYKIDDAASFKEHFNLKVVGYSASASVSKKTKCLLRFLVNEKNIVYVATYSKAYDIVDELDWTTPIRGNERYFKFLRHLEKNYTVDDKHEWKIITALKKGVGIYISPLPRYIKREIIRLYEENVLGTLIVTTSFTEGVNTNASNLIFTSLVNGPNTNKLSDIDILNVSGRAGRFAQKSIGKVYCISSEIYNRVIRLQHDSEIKLENYNYRHDPDQRIDYELDMIDNQYLNDEEIKIKEHLKNEMEELGLTPQDLHLSLNVSNNWKIALYKYFLSLSQSEMAKAYNACVDVLSIQPNKRIDSLNTIFELLRKSFEKSCLDGFPCQPYEIRAFDSHNKFIWGRLYGIYCAGNISKVISNNITFVRKQFDDIIEEYHLQNCTHERQVKNYFYDEKVGWILQYYHSDLKINFNAFFSETFKFISSIIQYKVPFYTSYFVSVLKLFMSKSNDYVNFDRTKLDVKKISLLFEDGSIYDDYSRMIDYGISNDLVMKLNNNNISIQTLKNGEYTKSLFDDYEQILIDEFLNIL